MWNGVQEIVTGGGAQTLAIVPWKLPSAATYVVEDLLESKTSSSRYIEGTEASPSAATIDATSETTTAAAGRGQADPRVMTGTGFSGITPGLAYAIVAADGRYELFRCFATSSTSVVAEQPLVGTYPSGSTITGIRVTGTFPAATADDDDNFEQDRPYRVTWNLTIDGVLVPIAQPIRLVRQKWDDGQLADLELWLRTTWQDIYRKYGDYAEVRAVCRFTAQRCAARLRKSGIDPSTYLGGPSGWDLLAARLILESAQRGFSPQNVDETTFLEDARREWAEAWSNVARGADARDVVHARRSDDAVPAAQPRTQRRFVRRA